MTLFLTINAIKDNPTYFNALRDAGAVIEAHTSLALAHDRDAAWYRAAFGRAVTDWERIRGFERL